MTKPQSLYKYDLDDSNIVDTYASGSIRVSKSLHTNKTTGFKVIHSEDNNSNIKVSYSNDFSDVYGINISNIIADVYNNTVVKYTFEIVDHFAKKDPFLDYITCYQVVVSLNDQDQVILPGNILFEPSNHNHQVYIRSISDISTLYIDDYNVNPSNIGYTFADIHVFQKTNNIHIDNLFKRHAVVSTILSNRYYSMNTGLFYTFQESTKYASIVLLEDDHNTSTNKPLLSIFQTFIWNGIVEPPIKTPDYDGIEITNLEKYPGSNVNSIVNRSNMLKLAFVMSSNQSLSYIERVCIIKHDLFSEEHVFMNIDVPHFISNSTLVHMNNKESIYNSIIDLNDDTYNQLILKDYQGFIYGAMKTINVDWDPVSIFEPNMIYDTTNQGTYGVETIQVMPTKIQLKVIQFDHATMAPHTVYITAVSGIDNSNTSTSTLNNITRTNYDFTVMLDSLTQDTVYNISITIDDGVNSPHVKFLYQEITPPVGKKPVIHNVHVNFDSYTTF